MIGDVDQGAVGDCYYLAGIASLAEFPERISRVLATPDVNAAGIYAFNVYVRGIPTLLVIDDYLPLYYSNYLAFAQASADSSIWSPIFEKAWAKINGNYEITSGGFPNEAWNFLAGVPSFTYKFTALDADSLWAIVSPAD